MGIGDDEWGIDGRLVHVVYSSSALWAALVEMEMEGGVI